VCGGRLVDGVVSPRSLLVVLALVVAGCTSSGTADTTAASGGVATTSSVGESFAGTEPAPEFPTGLDWLNVDQPLALADLKGKVVVLDFWTYGCINCIHIIPDLERLEEEYPDELVVIGVHSAKFENEGETQNIRQVVQRYGIEHPVVNDRGFEVWRQWGARAWPTVVVIDPAGNVVGGHSGEGVYDVLQPVVDSLVTEFDARGVLDLSPVEVSLESDGRPEGVLSFPGKVVADAEGGRLFVADTEHHRIVIADLATGEVLDVAGSGERGYDQGRFEEASFDQPQGMALASDGATLYVADVGNHAVRALDLDARAVTTLVGTGLQSPVYPPASGPLTEVVLSSPWDVALDGTDLYVAMAGSHQIWHIDLVGGTAAPFAGSGAEGVDNGMRLSAALAQPSGLAVTSDRVVFADSESSAIRYSELGPNGEVGLLAGTDRDLFDFGDMDGVGADVRLQHPLGVAFDGQWIYVADTYNSKIKRIDPADGETVTIAGGEQGWEDGAAARFSEPGGLDVAGGLLYVADTNNHAVRIVDPVTGTTETIVLYGIERFESDGAPVVALDGTLVAPGPGTLTVDVALPVGFKLNDIAPFTMDWSVDGDAVTLGPDADASIVEPTFPLTVPAQFTTGRATLSVDLTVYYCSDDATALCFIEQVRLEIPVATDGAAGSDITLRHRIAAPEL
jgi:DNA-binding beta-propeller fold protein YncE